MRSSAGAAVASVGGAVILVDGSSSSIPSTTLALLKDLDPQHIVIAGSTSAIKGGIEAELKSAFGSGMVTRVKGGDRYATSAALTTHFFTAADAVFFAVGTKFPDALAGAALAGGLGAPLVIAEKACVPAAVGSAVASLGPASRVLLGSPASLSDPVAALRAC